MYILQAVFNYNYGPDVPLEVRLGCSAENISLLNAEECLFYRYNKLGWIKYIWAIGLLAAGQSSTMTVSGQLLVLCVLHWRNNVSYCYVGYICWAVCNGGKFVSVINTVVHKIGKIQTLVPNISVDLMHLCILLVDRFLALVW